MTKDTDALREALKDLARGVFIDAATITHHSWVDGTNGREPDFGEYAGDYAESFADAYVDNITAALATPASDVAPVAWLYEIAGSGVWRLYKTRYTSPQQVAEGWTETPLYAHPPLAQSVDRALLDRAETAWQRFFYPANDCFDKSPAANKLPSLDLEVADCLRLLLTAVGHEVRPPAGGEVSIAHPVDPVAGGEALREVAAKYADMGIDERAEAMADNCDGDPWELIGYFREKLRQSQARVDAANIAATGFAKRLAALKGPAV